MPAWAIEGDLCAAAKFTTSLKGAATLRIAYGCLLEEKAASLPASKCVYFDGYAAAVWTSAHVEYVVSIESGVDQPSQPSINTFPCASSAADVSEFYARHPSGGGISSKTTGSCLLASLLHRCTNPGSRGWSDTLKYGLAHVGVRAFLHHSIVVGLCGTHPSIQPSARPDWKQRMRILRAGTHAMLVDADVVRASLYVKEAVRQSLAGVMATVPATHSALSCLLHPTRHLIQPPTNMPKCGHESAMRAFAAAGRNLCVSGNTLGLNRLSDSLAAGFQSQAIDSTCLWDTSWLGRGTPCVHSQPSLLHLTRDVQMASFKTNFLAFWAFAQSHGTRASRLDDVQCSAIHEMNAVARLVRLVDDSTLLKVQRRVLTNPAAGLLTLENVALEWGMSNIPPPSGCGGAQSPFDTVRRMGEAGSRNTSILFAYAKVAILREQLLLADFGDRVHLLQTRAMRRRHHLSEDADCHKLDAAFLWICVACARVANTHVKTTRHSRQETLPFDEVGVVCCQVDHTNGDLFCAKRSSTSQRLATLNSAKASGLRVECMEVDEDFFNGLSEPKPKPQKMSLGQGACMRRDTRSALEQYPRAQPCGASPLVKIPIVGRAVRIYGSWYALCTLCTTVICLDIHTHRYGADICCLRCDTKAIYPGLGDTPLCSNVEHPKPCRFCGALEEHSTKNNPIWIECLAPLDRAGQNRDLPPPLRKVWYCKKHYKQWLPDAHKVYETGVILAHISNNATPIGELQSPDESAQPAKKRRISTNRKGHSRPELRKHKRNLSRKVPNPI